MTKVTNIIFFIILNFLFIFASSKLIIGHRGACGIFPEHTFASYQEAIHSGVDYVEYDLVSTKDHQMLISHNAELSETTDIEHLEKYKPFKRSLEVGDQGLKSGWFTQDFTLKELKDDLYSKQRFPTRSHLYDGLFRLLSLEDGLAFCNASKVGVYIETKHPAYFRKIGLPLEEKLLQGLIKYEYIFPNMSTNPNKNLIIQSFESTSLKWFQERVKGVFLVQLIKENLDLVQNDTGIPYRQMMTPEGLDQIKTYAKAVGPFKKHLDREKVDLIHSKGLDVHTWTLRNDDLGTWKTPEEELEHLFNLGIDGFFTDFPKNAVDFKNLPAKSYVVYAIVGVMLFTASVFIFGVLITYIVSKLRKGKTEEETVEPPEEKFQPLEE